MISRQAAKRYFHEIMSIKKQVNTLEKLTLVEDSDYDGWSSSHYDLSEIVIFAVIKSMLHVTLHVIGAYLKLSIQAIKRDNFIKVNFIRLYI